MRYFDPLVKGQAIVMDERIKCPVCRAMFVVGDVIGLLPIQAHGDDGPSDRNIKSIPVHKRCYEPEEGEFHNNFYPLEL